MPLIFQASEPFSFWLWPPRPLQRKQTQPHGKLRPYVQQGSSLSGSLSGLSGIPGSPGKEPSAHTPQQEEVATEKSEFALNNASASGLTHYTEAAMQPFTEEP